MSQPETSLHLTSIEDEKTDFPWLLLAALSLFVFIINVDYTAVNLALPPMASDLHTSLNTLQWVLSGYVLAWAVLVIPGGNLTAKYQKKHLCLGGLALFMLGSFLAGISTSATLLIGSRVLQGIAAAISVPAAYALIYIHVAEKARGHAMGILSLGVGLGLAIGPFVGGALVTWLGWRSIFWINLPIGLLTCLMLGFNRQPEPAPSAHPMSQQSAVLVGTGAVLLLYTLGQWSKWAEQPWVYALLVSIAIVMLIAFVKLQKKLVFPLVPLQLFANKPYLGCCLGILIEQYCFSAIIVATGIYLQKILHFSPLDSSFMFLFMTVVFGVIATFGGALVDRKGIQIPTIVGMLILALGALLFSLLTTQSTVIAISAVLLIVGAGMGLAFIGLNTGIVKTIPQEYVGIGTSVFMMLALFGGALGVTFTTLLYEISSRTELLNSLQEGSTLFNGEQLHQLFSYIGSISPELPDLSAFDNQLQEAIIAESDSIFSHGINLVMSVVAALSLLAAIGPGRLLAMRQSR